MRLRRLLRLASLALRHAVGHLFGRVPQGPRRLRLALEEAGGTFIKLGQMLALQPDLLRRETCDALFDLMDRVPPFSFPQVEQVFLNEFGKGPSQLFDRFDRIPIASASIGQVHRAVLEGQTYAVKVQRPNVDETFSGDLRLLESTAALVRFLGPHRYHWLAETLREFVEWTREELDYRVEARYMDELARQTRGAKPSPHRRSRVPLVAWELTTERVLTAEFLDGLTLLDHLRDLIHPTEESAVRSRLEELGFDPTIFAARIVENFLSDVFELGVFHADLHPANLLILEDNVVGYVDFGITGVLSRHTRQGLISMTWSYARGDIHAVVDHFLNLSELSSRADPAAFRLKLVALSDDWFDRFGTEVHLRRSFTHVMLVLTRLSHETQIWPHREMAKYFRSVIAVDGLIGRFAPSFDLGQHLEVFCGRALSRQNLESALSYDRLMDQALAAIRLIESGPSRLQRILDRDPGRSQPNLSSDKDSPARGEKGRATCRPWAGARHRRSLGGTANDGTEPIRRLLGPGLDLTSALDPLALALGSTGLPKAGCMSRVSKPTPLEELERRLDEAGLRPSRLRAESESPRADELRLSRLAPILEAMGPVFLAFGRYLANRPDLFSWAGCSALERTTARRNPLNPIEIEELFYKRLGRILAPSELRVAWDRPHFALTSQWHRGLFANSIEVQICLNDPRFEEAVQGTRTCLPMLLQRLQVGRAHALPISSILEEFDELIRRELDLQRQAHTLTTLRQTNTDSECVVPEILEGLSVAGILTRKQLTSPRETALTSEALLAAWLRLALLEEVFPLVWSGSNALVCLPDDSVGLVRGPFASLKKEQRRSLRTYLTHIAAEDPVGSFHSLKPLLVPTRRSNEEQLRSNLRRVVPFREGQWPGPADNMTGTLVAHWREARKAGFEIAPGANRFLQSLTALVRQISHENPHIDPLRTAHQQLRADELIEAISQFTQPNRVFPWAQQQLGPLSQMPVLLDRALDRAEAFERQDPRGSSRPGITGRGTIVFAVGAILATGVLLIDLLPGAARTSAWTEGTLAVVVAALGSWLLWRAVDSD